MAASTSSNSSSTSTSSVGSSTGTSGSVTSGTGSTSTTSNSNGNFSGGSSSSSTPSKSSSSSSSSGPGAAHGDFSLGSNLGWVPSISLSGNNSGNSYNIFTGETYNSSTGTTSFGSGGTFNSSSSGSSGSNPFSSGSSSSTVAVDDVFGTGTSGYSTTSASGDYKASSNEKSDVSTSTFGTQDALKTSPTMISENKALVSNDSLSDVGGLVTESKDKDSQEVMEASKRRSNAEEQDKTNDVRNDMRSRIKNSATVDEETTDENTNTFQVGAKVAEKEETALTQAKQDLTEAQANKNQVLQDAGFKSEAKAQAYIEDTNAKLNGYKDKADNAKADLSTANAALKYADIQISDEAYSSFTSDDNISKTHNVEFSDGSRMEYNEYKVNTLNPTDRSLEFAYNKAVQQAVAAAESYRAAKDDYEAYNITEGKKAQALDAALTKANDAITYRQSAVDAAQKYYNEAFTAGETSNEDRFNAIENMGINVDALRENPSEADFSKTMRAIEESDLTDDQKAEATEAVNSIANSQADLHGTVQTIAEKGLENCTADEIAAYVNAQEQYNKNLENALNATKGWKETDFNKDFTESIALANDFNVTLPDGSTRSYSDFATGMVTKSPQIAKAMYEAKAERYMQDNNGDGKPDHPILAKIENMKAEWQDTYWGSKVGFADNKVRNQFNQMAETNMRATYAAYNNVLNDPNATDAQKAYATTQIEQAHALMNASAALKASTGFFSGAGTSPKDGTWGTTEASNLNAWQQAYATIGETVQIILGLGVSPAANKAYQKMYYLNQDGGAFEFASHDFDKDGFAWCEEYGNNAAAHEVLACTELATGVALMFWPATQATGAELIIDSAINAKKGLYSVRDDARKSRELTSKVTSYFNEASNLNGLDQNAQQAISQAVASITQTEDYQVTQDEVDNLDNWLEGSGSNTATNDKFNQSLTYDEWLKLIESDETMRKYAQSLVDKEKNNAKENNADAGVNA